MLHLVYSRDTAACTEYAENTAKELTDAGKTVYMFVPETAVLSQEKRIFAKVSPKANLCFQVLSFKRLANNLHRYEGGFTKQTLTESSKAVMTALAIQNAKAALKRYGSICSKRDFITVLSGKIDALKAAGITETRLSDAVGCLNSSHLSDKLSDLSMFLAEYGKLMADSYDDGADRLEQCAKCLKKSKYFEGSTVLINGFAGFTRSEASVILSILPKAKDVYVTICADACDKASDGIFKKPVFTARLLKLMAAKEGVKIAPPIAVPSQKSSDGIEKIKKELWGTITECDRTANDVEIYSCTSKTNEAESAAMLVLGMCREYGFALRDIAICCADTGDYGATVDYVFGRYGIPVYISEKTDFSSTMLYKLIFASVEVCRRGYLQEDVLAVLKSGLSKADKNDADLFELYVNTWKIDGRGAFVSETFDQNGNGLDRATKRGDSIREGAQRAKEALITPLVSLESEFDASESVKDFAKAIYRYTAELSTQKALQESADFLEKCGDRRMAACVRQLWSSFCDSLDDLVTVAGDRKCDLAEFSLLLSAALSSQKLSAIPEYIDQCALLDSSSLCAVSPKALIVLGACENVFPKRISPDSFFSNNELKLLKSEAKLDLFTDENRFECEALREFYNAVTLPTQKLILLYDENSQKSAGTAQIEKIVHTKVKKSKDIPYMGARAAFELYAKTGSEKLKDAAGEYGKEHIDRLSAQLDMKDGAVSKTTADKIFSGNIVLSPSSVEDFSKCPLKYWCQRQLNLRPEATSVLKMNTVGTLLHSLLEAFFSNFIKKREELCKESGSKTVLNETLLAEYDNAKIKEWVDGFIDDYIDIQFGKAMGKSERFLYSVRRLSLISRLILTRMVEEIRQSGFAPWKTEYKIDTYDSENSVKGLSVDLEDGKRLTVKGSADRVDIFTDNGTSYVRVVDYKSGERSFDMNNIDLGLDLQMLMYLFSVCENDTQKLGNDIRAAGVLYYPIGRESKKDKDGDDFDEELTDERISEKMKKSYQPNGVVLEDPKIIGAMDAQNGVFIDIKPGKDGYKTNSHTYLQTEEQMQDLRQKLISVIEEKGKSIVSGCAKADPVSVFVGEDVCKYCDFKALCRIEKDSVDNDTDE